MKLTLQRRPSVGGATIGELMLDGIRVCYTLEDEIREMPGDPVWVWKVKGATAIPAGRYRVTLEQSARFGPDTLTINGVDGFSAIRMHGGNTQADTEGCPLLGFQVTATTIVGGTSAPAVAEVKKLVRGAIEAGDEVWIDVCNPTAEA